MIYVSAVLDIIVWVNRIHKYKREIEEYEKRIDFADDIHFTSASIDFDINVSCFWSSRFGKLSSETSNID